MIENFLNMAAEEAEIGVEKGEGGPFGAVIVDKDYNIISRCHNMVLASNDPTNHAEIVAIREACRKLKTHDLTGYTIFSSCEPCPMCLSAIIWSNIKKVYFGATREDADKCNFKDKKIYDYLEKKNNILEEYNVTKLKCVSILNNYKGDRY